MTLFTPTQSRFKTKHPIACPEKSKHDVAFQSHYFQSVDQEIVETIAADLVTDKVSFTICLTQRRAEVQASSV